MGKLVIVNGDAVTGTCTHKVSGTDNSSGSPVPCSGDATYSYSGKMDSQLSNFVSIGDQAVALVNSESNLNSPHVASAGVIAPTTCVISSFVGLSNAGVGKPFSTAGSSFVKINGIKVLLNNDQMDTCGNQTNNGGSSVAASTQAFVSCSE